MTELFLITSLFVFLILGVPIAISLGLSSSLTLLLFGNQSLIAVVQRFFHTMEVYPLLAVPFFILAGTFMTTGGVARRMIDFAIALTGAVRGGLAMAAVLACMFFAAVSGSSPATVIAVGSIAIAGMVGAGYSKAFATGVVANAGTLGILIPPSIVMVVYGAITETSVAKLFIAGLIPGLLLTAGMMAVIYFTARVKQMPVQPRTSFREVLRTGRDAIWGLLLVFIIMGGIYGGIFTPTEAAAVSAVYAFLVAVFVYGDVKLAQVPKVLTDSARITAMLMFIVANAYLFAFVLTTEQIPQSTAAAILDLELAPWAFLLIVNVLLLIAGNFMVPSSIVLILAPILFPIAVELGIDPIHFGIVMVINMEIGMVTPPVGLNLFVASGIMGLPLTTVIKSAAPWLALMIVLLLVITYVPAISLLLPNSMYGH